MTATEAGLILAFAAMTLVLLKRLAAYHANVDTQRAQQAIEAADDGRPAKPRIVHMR